MAEGEAPAVTSSTTDDPKDKDRQAWDSNPHEAADLFQAGFTGGQRVKHEAPTYAQKAWICLDADSFPRKQAISIVSNPFFDHFILSLIVLNCITMMVFNEPVLKRMIESHPSDFDSRSSWAATDRNVPFFVSTYAGCIGIGPCSIADWIDWCFLVLFAVEMTLKMLASGLMLHPNSYLRSGWNWLDFIVVIVGFIEMYTVGLPGISTLRLVKTLRPLRSLQRIRGMRVLVQCILEAMPQMCRVLVFLFVVIFFFALIGVALFKGGLRYSCHTLADDNVTWESTGAICRPHCSWTEDSITLQGECLSLGANTLGMENYDPHLTADWVYTCRTGQQCLCSFNGLPDPTCDYRSNPNYGITSFDSMPWAIISLFQAISLEGWVDMMYQLQDGISSWVWVYFVMLVLFGAIIVINLFLAVLCDNFDMADKKDEVGEDDEDMGKTARKELKDLKHSNGARQAVLNLVQNPYFDWFVQFCIVLNTVVMTLRYAPWPEDDLRMTIDNSLRSTDYMPAPLFWFMFYMNIILTAIFTLESLLKIIGFGPRLFAMDYMNDFDFVVVAISIFEIAIDPKILNADITFPLPISVLRAFRIFRLFKLAKSIGSIKKILVTLIQSMGSVFYLALLLLLMILIFVLLGMELFGGYYPRPELNFTASKFPNLWDVEQFPDKAPRWEGEASRYHFDDPGNACLAIFVVLSGENWNEIMFHTHEASWDGNMAAKLPLPYALMYFIGLFFVGNLLLFNLFIAILLSNFDDDDDDEEESEEMDDAKEPPPPEELLEWKFDGYVHKSHRTLEEAELDDAEEAPANPLGSKFPTDPKDFNGDKSLMVLGWDNPVRVFSAQLVTHPWFEAVIVILILVSTVLMLLDMPTLSETHWSRVVIKHCNTFFTVVFLLEMFFKWLACGVFVSKTAAGYQLSDAYFRGAGAGWNVLDFVIVVISVVMLFDVKELKMLRAFRAFRPLRLVQRYEDLKITVATLFQSVPAMGSLISVAGLFFLIFAILGVELYGGKLGSCFDPDYADEPFGSRVIPGMNKGQTDYEECMALPRYNITRRTTHGILLTDMADMFPNAEPNWLRFTEFPQWFYPQFGHYDNLINSLALLFEISALEGWPDVMHYCMDSDQDAQYVVPWKIGSDVPGAFGGVDTPMGDNVHRPQTGITAVFFIAWIIMGCFVVVNMTVGIVCDTFSQIKAENDGLLLMSEDAADWVKAQKQVFAQRPLVVTPPPKEPWRHGVHTIVASTRFESAIMLVIVLNVAIMGLGFWEPQLHEFDTGEVGGAKGDPNSPNIATYNTVMMGFNLVFLFVYLVEMVLKWIGLGVKHYFGNFADRFDFFLVVVSTGEAIITFLPGESFPIGFIRVLRLFRVVRIMRVVKSAKQMRAIIQTVIMSVPQLKNILVLIVLLIIVTDVLCVSIFWAVNYTPGNHDWTADHAESISRGEVMPMDDAYYFSDDGTNWGDMINRHANFQYFWTGLLVLVRSSTGESFNGIMHDLYDWSYGDNRMQCCPECGPMLDGDMVTYTIVRDAAGDIIPGKSVTMMQPLNSCGSSPWAFLIYFIFQNAMAYIVLSIMIGIILENFAQVGSEARKIRIDDIEEFRDVWLKYDPKGTYVVYSHNLLAILQQLSPPLGIAGAAEPMTRSQMLEHLGHLDIPDHGGFIHFTETLTAMCNNHAGVAVPVCDSSKKIAKAAQNVPKIKTLDHATNNALHSYLATVMQVKWRAYTAREGGAGGAGGDGPPPQQFVSQPPAKKSQVAPEPE